MGLNNTIQALETPFASAHETKTEPVRIARDRSKTQSRNKAAQFCLLLILVDFPGSLSHPRGKVVCRLDFAVLHAASGVFVLYAGRASRESVIFLLLSRTLITDKRLKVSRAWSRPSDSHSSREVSLLELAVAPSQSLFQHNRAEEQTTQSKQNHSIHATAMTS